MIRAFVSVIVQAARRGAIALCLVAATGTAAGQETPSRNPGEWKPETFTLSNGLTAIILPDHRAPVVTHVLWYRVGSADEVEGKSGLAHFLEHLMFKSTKTMAAGEYNRVVARNGGQMNARTSYDYTNYFFRVARDRLPLMMQLEADRMVALALNDREVFAERSVVQEERRQVVDSNPGAILDEQVWDKLFAGHPYAVPVIGRMEEVARLSRGDAADWYHTWYGPENALLVVAGDITAGELKPLAESTYGQIPRRGDLKVRVWPAVSPLKAIVPSSRMRTRKSGRRAGRATGSACRWGMRMRRRCRLPCRSWGAAAPGGSIAAWSRAGRRWRPMATARRWKRRASSRCRCRPRAA